MTGKYDKTAKTGSVSTFGDITTDTNAALTTTGSIGRGTTGNVTAATITSTNASHDGSTLTLTHGADGVTFSNGNTNFGGNNESDTSAKDIYATTSLRNSAGTSTTYSYMTFGTWFHDQMSGSGNIVDVTEVGGLFVHGSATDPANIPSTGTATYTGAMKGGYVTTDFIDTYGDMRATADFAARSLSFATSNTKSNDNAPLAHLDMSGTLSYSANSNLFAGSVTDGGGRSGTVTGRFYGPAAEEIGGVFGLTSSGAGSHVGFFGGKK